MALYAFYRAEGDWRDRLVRNRTWSPYSHTELLLTRPLGGAAWCISASKRDDAQVRAKLIKFKPGHWDFIDVPGIDPDEAWERAAAHLGEPYDTLGAILTVTPWARARPGLWFCSELMGLSARLHEPYRHHPGSLAAAFLTQRGGTRWRQPTLGGATY